MSGVGQTDVQAIQMPAGILFTFMKLAAQENLPITDIASKHHLDLETLLAQECISVSVFETLMEELIACSEGKDFHLKFAKEFTFSHIDGFEEFIITGSSGYETIKQVFSYKELFIPLLDVKIIERDGLDVLHYASNTWHPISDKYYYSELLFAIIQYFGYRLLNFATMAQKIYFRHEKKTTHEQMKALFQCPIEYAALDDLAYIKPGVLTAPFNSKQVGLHDSIQKVIENQLHDLQQTDSFVLKVEKLIEEHLADPGFTVEELSSLLSFSSRKLQRLLKDNNTTFKDIKNEVRVRKATALLKKTSTSFADIAESLGFSSVSTFSRFFKKHFQCTPKEYRDSKT